MTEVNIESAVIDQLLAEDVGSNYGRTVELHTNDGKYVIKTIAKGSKVI